MSQKSSILNRKPRDSAKISITGQDPNKPVSKARAIASMNQYSKQAEIIITKYKFEPICENPNFTGNPGFGPYLYPDGSTYVGQYLRGYKCGVGEEVNSDGSGYIGNWEYDEK